MNKKEELEQLFRLKKTLSSREVTLAGYARIYITMLVNDGFIHKISRGVYSTSKETTINSLHEFQKNNKKVIYSCFTSLYLQGFYKVNPSKTQISVPQGYNASRYKDMEVFYNSSDNYGVGATSIEYKGKNIKVYNIERSICEIIKYQGRFDKGTYNKLINYYFNLNDINYSKLLEYSKLLKIAKRVQGYLALFKA